MLRVSIWLVLVFVMVLSPFIGAVPLNITEILNATSLDSSIFFELRLPRVLFAFFAGLILGLAGLVFQTLFRNPLMTPYTLGISSGAVLGAGIAIKLGLSTLLFGIAAISVFGFLGAFFTVLLLLYLARFLATNQHQSLLLLGIALSLFYTSALMIVFYLGTPMQNDTLMRFTMGSLSVIGWSYPLSLALIGSLFLLTVFLYRFELQILNISESGAQLKGINTKRVTLILLLLSSLAIGVLVSISGPIGFIGLIVPHIVSRLYPLSVRRRILHTALFGGLFLLLCDTITRAIQTQSELPIGIVTALIGGPFFIYLIISRSQNDKL